MILIKIFSVEANLAALEDILGAMALRSLYRLCFSVPTRLEICLSSRNQAVQMFYFQISMPSMLFWDL